MKNDILPPVRPSAPDAPSSDAVSPTELPPVAPPENTAPSDGSAVPETTPVKKPRRRHVWLIVGGIVALLVLLAAAAFGWYAYELRPVASHDTTLTRVRVVQGSSPTQIGQLLQNNHLIRSTLAFEIYTRLSGARSKLQAGTYSISPSESTADVVSHLVSGQVDQFTVTFYPGATLRDNAGTPEKKKTDVETMLKRAGYTQAEINEAFTKRYDVQQYPIFADKPASASLEGYVYGETYNFDSSSTADQVLGRTFDEFYAAVKDHHIEEGLKRQHLTLYQGITLASIIQREVSSTDPSRPSADQKQVAQVFYTRLARHIPLGSDVTAYYGADLYGLPRAVATDTPYNTRIHAGLPPGPIAAPSIGALEAAAYPAAGDYLYFLSGDDGKTYFSRTDDEHEANIRDHCKIKCAVS